MYDPEKSFELTQLAEHFHKKIDESVDKFGEPMRFLHSIVDNLDRLANDYLNSCDEEEKKKIREEAIAFLDELEKKY